MERYEEIVLNEIEDSRDAMREAFDKQIELQIEALELEIQLKIDTNEAERQLNDFIKTYIDGIEEDDYAGTAKFNIKQIGTYTGADGDLAIKTNAMNDALDAYRKIKAGGTDDIYGDDAEKAMEAYKQYRDEAMDIYSEIKDLIDEIGEAQVSAIDNSVDEMDKHIDQYDRIGDELERNLELSKLISGENDYDTQLKYYDAIKKNNREQVQALKEKVDYLKEEQKLAKDSGNQELIDTIAEQLLEAEEALAEKTAESLEMIAEAYDVAAKKLQDDLEKSMTNGLGLEYISEEWEMINDNADLYLDAINSAYEISKLEADIMDAIDNTDSLYAQERLNKLRDQELGKLRQKEKITKYDVERANKMLDIELKRIALEEAQSSKTQMRLSRDSQGNYTYQYVSDDSKVSEAQKALDEAQNELYNMDKEQYKTVLDDYKDALSDYMDDVADLMENYEEGTEEFYRQLQLIKDKYRPKLEGAFDMMVTAEGNLDDSAAQELLKHYGVNLDELSEKDREYYMKNIIPQLNSEMAKSLELYGDQGFDAVFDDWTERLIKLMDDKKKEMKDAGVEGGIDPDKVTDPSIDMSETYKDMDNTMDSLVDKHKDINSSLRESAKYAKEYSDNMKDAADKFVQAVKAGNKLIAWSESGEDVSVSGADNPDKPTSNKGKDTKTNTKDDKLPSNKSNPNVETIMGEVQGRWELTGQGNDKVLYEMQSSTAALNLINPIQDIGALIDKLDDSLSHRLDKLEYTTSAAFANLERLLRELSDKERDILEQQVTISADFPNVLEAKEIEEAFMNLTNLASQHAYHTSR